MKIDNSLVNLKDTIDTYTDCKILDIVNPINGVSDLVSSNFSLSAGSAGRCDQYYNNFLDNSNVLSIANCVRPTVGVTYNSWMGTEFVQPNHESWCDIDNSKISIQFSCLIHLVK